MPVSKRETDVRACALQACHRVGLYTHLRQSNSASFLDRACDELVEVSDADCPIGPPYNDVLLTFRQALRACLEKKRYSGFKIYLQRLCTRDFTWKDFCRYHADRL